MAQLHPHSFCSLDEVLHSLFVLRVAARGAPNRRRLNHLRKFVTDWVIVVHIGSASNHWVAQAARHGVRIARLLLYAWIAGQFARLLLANLP